MTFEPLKVQSFIEVFNASKNHIKSFEGCMHLELLKDINSTNIYFTYSYWRSEEDLLKYRSSQLFKDTWEKTRALFSEKAEAWSLTRVN